MCATGRGQHPGDGLGAPPRPVTCQPSPQAALPASPPAVINGSRRRALPSQEPWQPGPEKRPGRSLAPVGHVGPQELVGVHQCVGSDPLPARGPLPLGPRPRRLWLSGSGTLRGVVGCAEGGCCSVLPAACLLAGSWAPSWALDLGLHIECLGGGVPTVRSCQGALCAWVPGPGAQEAQGEGAKCLFG